MRISTSMLFGTGTQGLQDLQSDLFKLQNQMSTGRRILTPSDDPIGAWEAQQVSQSQSINNQYISNQDTAVSRLSYMEANLTNLEDGLARIYELAATGKGKGDAQRAALVPELEELLQNVLTLANAKDGTGNYIYSGTMSSTKPFTASGSGIAYAGDQGQQQLRVSSSNVMEMGHNGFDVFMQVKDAQGNQTGSSIFETVQNLIDIFDPTSGVPFDETTRAQLQDQLSVSIDHVANRIASVGTRLNTLDDLKVASKDFDLQYATRLQDLQEVDYTAAISQFSQLQLQLQAAQLTFKQSSQMSLFSIL
ncbi:flagellar hook-associated protein FlgL [Azonexus caeni]|uniref:flagellar hook-associated protein FlgL n=1 Tax=Azonexus caeni TaxID=266126 RepID=UPI003A85285E